MSTEEQSLSPGKAAGQPTEDELLKARLYKSLRFVLLVAAVLLVSFVFSNKYKLGSQAFDKGWWASSIDFLGKVKPDSEDYEAAQEMIKIAEEKLKQEQAE